MAFVVLLILLLILKPVKTTNTIIKLGVGIFVFSILTIVMFNIFT
ncbi:hypothetical protein [Staphylococcus xylosus]|nr:hypothetical protein [Staphylococcus xylosus]